MKKVSSVLCTVIAVIVLFAMEAVPASAERKQTIYSSPYVELAPDGKAWTTNAGDRDIKWYDKNTTVFTGISSAIRSLETGEHYYRYDRTGEIPIGNWKVEMKGANCCHNSYPPKDADFHGISYTRNNCLVPHYSGWLSYCADCGGRIENSLIYMSREAADSIDYFEVGTGMDYYYLCPFCNNLEQGVGFIEHQCKAISWNQYKVIYDANTKGLPHGGYMPESFHMYNNATEYEGKAVTPITHLTKNSYTRIGYEFVEWNTEPDGSGRSFCDGQEILNLTDRDLNKDGDAAAITLYAQWRKSSGTLHINPNGGSYNDKTSATVVTGSFGNSYKIMNDKITAPKGYTVSFHTNGGSSVASITSTRHFTEWSMVNPFDGRLKNDTYYFVAPDGNKDMIVANYELNSITLPSATKTGSSFGGWYYDPECTEPAGGSGDKITPSKDITLYAGWVDLKLSSEDNYNANGGKGAVNLSWAQSDNNSKTYKVYQSRDNATWKLITSAADIGNQAAVSQSFKYTGSSKTYTAPYSGIYTLTAYGAQGGNYGSNKGGYGGRVTARVWLREGEKLTYTIGGQNGYNGGGSGSAYGTGGGSTTAVSDRQGTLLIAGGGGGASASGSGGAGGSATSLRADKNSMGASGQAGGGAGYVGGNAGEYILHNHNGNSASGGTCYTQPITCGGTAYEGKVKCGTFNQRKVEECSNCHQGPIAHSPGNPYGACDNYIGIVRYYCTCGALGTDGETHYVSTGTYTCETCGTSYSSAGRCTQIAEYALTCEYKQGQIISSKPAYGGNNYVNTHVAYAYSQSAGVHAGNGAFSIQSEAVGYLNALSLGDVVATDFAVPGSISVKSVTKESLSGTQVRVNWEEPDDNGTDYYHVAESYIPGSMSPLCRSNTTKNTLVSGIKGYYYLIDTNPSTGLTALNGRFTGEKNVRMTVGTQVKYLHVAAVDKAGNIGNTIHIKIEAKDVAWKLGTEQLSIEENDNVYQAVQDKTWFVRADGRTPFTLHHKSYVDGPATAEYQPNYIIYESLTDGMSAGNIIYTPPAAIQDGEVRLDAEDLSYSVEGTPILTQYPNSYTVRTERNRYLLGVQAFVLPSTASGKRIKIIPVAGADRDNGIIYSNHEADQKNGLTLIGDGEGPAISGLDILENTELINRNDGSITLNAKASDDLSGIKDFYLEITNTDNANSKIYTPEADGRIVVEITKDEPIFSGDFIVRAYAIDNVGNEAELEFATTEFALSATLERILEPHEPIFKCGESGILSISTYGYAEKVEVEFPPEMTSLKPELNQVFHYSDRANYIQREEIQFMIPLYTPANTQYTITVRAYKGDKRLEEYPTFSTISVEGSVLDEFRTRLR